MLRKKQLHNCFAALRYGDARWGSQAAESRSAFREELFEHILSCFTAALVLLRFFGSLG